MHKHAYALILPAAAAAVAVISALMCYYLHVYLQADVTTVCADHQWNQSLPLPAVLITIAASHQVPNLRMSAGKSESKPFLLCSKANASHRVSDRELQWFTQHVTHTRKGQDYGPDALESLYLKGTVSLPCAVQQAGQGRDLSWSSEAVMRRAGSTPSTKARRVRGPSSSSVVTCVMRARFFTRPQLSPSGVSAGHSMPHWLGCRALGPLTCTATNMTQPFAGSAPRHTHTKTDLSVCLAQYACLSRLDPFDQCAFKCLSIAYLNRAPLLILGHQPLYLLSMLSICTQIHTQQFQDKATWP